MRKSRFSEEQIIDMLREQEAGSAAHAKLRSLADERRRFDERPSNRQPSAALPAG